MKRFGNVKVGSVIYAYYKSVYSFGGTYVYKVVSKKVVVDKDKHGQKQSVTVFDLRLLKLNGVDYGTEYIIHVPLKSDLIAEMHNNTTTFYADQEAFLHALQSDLARYLRNAKEIQHILNISQSKG